MSNEQKAQKTDSNRKFMEDWCIAYGNYAPEFYKRLNDGDLEKEYENLTGDWLKELPN